MRPEEEDDNGACSGRIKSIPGKLGHGPCLRIGVGGYRQLEKPSKMVVFYPAVDLMILCGKLPCSWVPNITDRRVMKGEARAARPHQSSVLPRWAVGGRASRTPRYTHRDGGGWTSSLGRWKADQSVAPVVHSEKDGSCEAEDCQHLQLESDPWNAPSRRLFSSTEGITASCQGVCARGRGGPGLQGS